MEIRPYTNKDLARLYNCSTKTITRNIAGIRKNLGTRNGHRWNIEQVRKIFAHMGIPFEELEVSHKQYKHESIHEKSSMIRLTIEIKIEYI